ncbi:hypothetical protein GCM10009865_41850 [Aeromicrobium ponti]|uniref:hypothetical protein n=1 Tax=Cytobacillus oceanisediminis TaxID=665099 RepID=UPI00131513F8|nr:hypothetical protein [Cytobacillus oceanisediminis]
MDNIAFLPFNPPVSYLLSFVLLNNGPFISEGYYQSYNIKEFLEANNENNWLISIPQTQENLID